MVGRVLGSLLGLSLLFVPRAEASLINATYDIHPVGHGHRGHSSARRADDGH